MRNAALILGIIAGLVGMVVGFFSYGYTQFVDWFGEVPNIVEQVNEPQLIRTTSLLAPLAAIAGGAMARSRAMLGGILMLLSAAGMYHAFGFGVFTMFPIAMAALGGLLAVTALRPDAQWRRQRAKAASTETGPPPRRTRKSSRKTQKAR